MEINKLAAAVANLIQEVKTLKNRVPLVFEGLDGSPGKDGKDGVDADPEVVADIVLKKLTNVELIDEQAIVNAIFEKIPTPTNGRDGKDVDPDDILKIVETVLARIPDAPSMSDIIEALPPGPDGLQGERGPSGPPGPVGPKGPRGKSGRGIKSISLKNNKLTVTYTDGVDEHAGDIELPKIRVVGGGGSRAAVPAPVVEPPEPVSLDGYAQYTGTPLNRQIPSWNTEGELRSSNNFRFDDGVFPTIYIGVGGILNIGLHQVFRELSGTLTLGNIDAIDAITQTTLENTLNFGGSSISTRNDNTTETLPAQTITRTILTTGDITKTLPTIVDGDTVGVGLDSTGGGKITVSTSDTILFGGQSLTSLTLAAGGDNLTLVGDATNGVWRVSHDGIQGPSVELGYVGPEVDMTPNVMEKVAYDSVVSDNHDMYSVLNSRVTPLHPGHYTIEFTVAGWNNEWGNTEIFICKNGTDFRFCERFLGSDGYEMTGKGSFSCNGSTDYIEIFIRTDAGTTTPNNYSNASYLTRPEYQPRLIVRRLK